MCSPVQAAEQPRVVLGGTSGLPSLADPSATSAFRARSGTGFYLHFNATDPLFAPALPAIAKVFAGKPIIAEIALGGGFTPQFWTTGWRKSVLSYGFAPTAAVVNVDMGKVDAPSAALSAEIEQFKAFAKAGRASGVTVLAPVTSPNDVGGSGPEGDVKALAVRHPWLDPWWDGFRQMALIGGGIAFDAPPAFFLRGFPDHAQQAAYQAFTIAALRWATEHRLWTTFIMSPYFDGVVFQDDSENTYRVLQRADALPQTWIVENYSLCGPPYVKTCTASDAAFMAPVGEEGELNSEAAVALWFSKHR